MTKDQLPEHYKAVYAALNQFWPIPGRDDVVAVNLKALALVLDNPLQDEPPDGIRRMVEANLENKPLSPALATALAEAPYISGEPRAVTPSCELTKGCVYYAGHTGGCAENDAQN